MPLIDWLAVPRQALTSVLDALVMMPLHCDASIDAGSASYLPPSAAT
jgi:hypothetical protein